MVRGVYIQRAPSERVAVEAALKRYLYEATPTSGPLHKPGSIKKRKFSPQHLRAYSLATLNAEIAAQFWDTRLAGDTDEKGKIVPRSNNTVDLELTLLSHMFTVAIKEWSIGLPVNPVYGTGDTDPLGGTSPLLTLRKPIWCSLTSRGKTASAGPIFLIRLGPI